LNGVGADNIIAAMIGRFVGMKAEVLANQGIISPESG
jgi:hypothetical protein